ncbi:hypothetical protein [Mycolicibacterium mengxianglii]|uniref:hypothetical protein n=1 Tax=Mycolicibacterium mengxianglii TaxID=2736649 RepID=UPI0018D18A8C|nr:hypothetical protein [Mycolicibacterium mengxianglii]
MQISARSYLTAGISLTAATAIALTPLAVPANQHAVSIPSVTVSDIQLAVTPSEIRAFFTALQADLAEFNEGLATAVGLPGQTLDDALETAINLNAQLFTTLRSLTTNPTLTGLLDALEASSDYGLGSLQEAIVDINTNPTSGLVLTTEQLANLFTSSITGSLSNVLSSFVAVLNNPLSTSALAGLLSTGAVGTAQLLAGNGLSAVGAVGDFGFNTVWDGIALVDNTIWNAIDTIYDLSNVAAGATGSALIAAITELVQSVTLAPGQAIADVAFGLTFDALGAAWEGFGTVVGGAQSLVAIAGGTLQYAINTVGAAPLNPQSYLVATGALLAGGFDGFNSAVGTVGSVAQLPFTLGANITRGVSGVITGLNEGFAQALSGVLAAAGLPAAVVALPLALAGQINAVIEAGTDVVADGFDTAAGLVEAGTGFVIHVSNEIENAIFNLVPVGAGVAPGASAAKIAVDQSNQAGDPSGGAALVDDEDSVSDDVVETPEEESPEAEAPAEDAPEETSTDDTSAGDDATDDDAAADEDKASNAEAKSEEREAEKAERDTKKAERQAKSDTKSDSGSDSGSESGSDD